MPPPLDLPLIITGPDELHSIIKIDYDRLDNYNMYVIITGPAADLFEADYYNDMKKALKPNGIVCCQGNNIYFIYLS